MRHVLFFYSILLFVFTCFNYFFSLFYFVLVAMKLPISLFCHLENLMAALGGPEPEVVQKESTPGKAKVVISLDLSKFPFPIVSGLPKQQQLFIGVDPHNSEAAEHKAIISVKKFLEENFGLEIHDFSHAKIGTFELKMAQLVSGLKSFTIRLRSYLKEYQSSINLLRPILNSAPVSVSPVFTEISNTLSRSCSVAESAIARFEEQLLALEQELTSCGCNCTPTTSNQSSQVVPDAISIYILVCFFFVLVVYF